MVSLSRRDVAIHLLHFSKMRPCAGFSLVEVAIALGIVSFVLITLAGLQPVGLNSLRQSMDTTFETQILNQMAADISLSPFSEIYGAYNDKEFLYTGNGVLTQDSAEARFRLKVSVELATDPFPGAPAGIGNSLRTVRMDITKSAGGDAGGLPGVTRVLHVAHSDPLAL